MDDQTGKVDTAFEGPVDPDPVGLDANPADPTDTAMRPVFDKEDLPSDPSTWQTFRNTAITRATRIEGPFIVETSDRPLRCADGWLAVDARGYPYPIAADEFSQVYQEVPDDDGFELVFGEHQVAKLEPLEREIMAKTLQSLRQEYAAAKLQYQLRLLDHPALKAQKAAHPEQIKRSVEALAACVAKVEELIEAGEVPLPTKLEVVGGDVKVAREVPSGDDPSAA